jgi:O-antigen ligase
MTPGVSLAGLASSYQRSAVVLLLVLPWLNPWTSGPSPEVLPWLMTLACLAAVLGTMSQNWALWAPPITLAWLLAALLSSVIGLMQYMGASAAGTPWVSSAALGEAFANLRQRNQFASLTNIGLLVVLGWAAQAHRLTKNRRWTTGLMLSTVLLALGNAASSSRTGFVQLGLIVTMAWWWHRQSPHLSTPLMRRLLLAAVVGYLLAALVLPVMVGQAFGGGIFARLQDGGAACSSRMVLWSNVMQLIAQKPWLGWGWDGLRYAHFITLYEGPRFCEIMGNAHNLPLHLAVTLGLPAAVLLCGGGTWLVWRAKPWRETEATRQMAWGVLAVIGLHSLLEYPLWYGPFQMAVGCCLLLLLWLPRAQVKPLSGSIRDQNNMHNWPVGQSIRASAAITLLAAMSYAAWDYHRISQIYLPVAQRSAAYKDHTLEKIRSSWLFQDQVLFAELTTTPLTRDNAVQLNALAHRLLHYAPEARVVETLIDSARLLGREDEAQYFALRYRAAYAKVR